mmetsp:Transcript_20332/g.46126  ORF Transcript_20332/g.46126 Transcript_20332/m.46126 type:complete len:270 (+) Transcript_20332:109-918(+)
MELFFSREKRSVSTSAYIFPISHNFRPPPTIRSNHDEVDDVPPSPPPRHPDAGLHSAAVSLFGPSGPSLLHRPPLLGRRRRTGRSPRCRRGRPRPGGRYLPRCGGNPRPRRRQVQTRQTQRRLPRLFCRPRQSCRRFSSRRNVLRRPPRHHRNDPPHRLHPHRGRNHPRRRGLGPAGLGALPHHHAPDPGHLGGRREGHGGDRLPGHRRDTNGQEAVRGRGSGGVSQGRGQIRDEEHSGIRSGVGVHSEAVRRGGRQAISGEGKHHQIK